MRCLLVLAASAAALRPSNAPLPLVEKSRRAFCAAAVASAFVALPANAKIDVNNAMAREFSAYPCVEINQCVGWFRRAVRNRHCHAIEQASRRWRGGRREEISANAP